MPKNSLGQTFVRSLVRQVGRDAGRVVSNKAFGNAHSSPIRIVKSTDTSPQFSGKRRSYRHDLDRVVNGDLPSTSGSAKKAIVKLENALEEFLNEMMPISTAQDVHVIKSWLEKSLDFLSDVVKIVDKPDVVELEEKLRRSIGNIKQRLIEKVNSIEIPVDETLSLKRRKARFVFWFGAALLLLPVFVWSGGDTEITTESNVGGMETTVEAKIDVEPVDMVKESAEIDNRWMYSGLGFWTMVWGGILIRRNTKKRKAFEERVKNLRGMKAAAGSWS